MQMTYAVFHILLSLFVQNYSSGQTLIESYKDKTRPVWKLVLFPVDI